jgi:hypothetical protein
VLVRLDRSPGADAGALSRDLVTVEIPSGTTFKEGDAVEVGLPEHALHVFDAQSGHNLLAERSAA